jgi:hypothetical protein
MLPEAKRTSTMKAEIASHILVCAVGRESFQGSPVPKVASVWHEPGRVVVSLVAHR